MTRYDELKYLIPPRIQSILAHGRRDPDRMPSLTFRVHMRRHKQDVDQVRRRVDARLKYRTEEYSRRGLSIDRPDFITRLMRDEMELLYQLNYGIAVATEEYNAIRALAKNHGN